MTIVERISTNSAPRPLGHYSQAIRAAGFIYVSGQLPLEPEKMHGQDGNPFEEQARIALHNLLAVLDAAGAKPSHVLRVTAYIVGAEHWAIFNKAYAEAFGDARPARSVVPVPALHDGHLIELDAIALDSPDSAAGPARAAS
ncbi:RidA family protein [Neoaquamicrobium sediminum]|uniref:RidA family protein n=1 Tax=Neoaquamicrobium sediminum TaxID=1849104 RepID=UPI0015662A73|nr:RidA family protein [Mesorhizobium sediminum]NRC57341.1 RidA family protein [Mesorhizobium sediminum]